MSDQLGIGDAPIYSGPGWQNDLIVSAYFDIHRIQIAGGKVNKKAIYRDLAERINRLEGYVENKMQNISAVLELLEMPWAKGLAPSRNRFETALVEAIQRHFDASPFAVFEEPSPSIVLDTAAVEVEPPQLRPAKPLDPKLERIARKYNHAERDFQNRDLGRRGEEFVLKRERDRLSAAGKHKLADRVEWTADIKGDGVGYDIQSFNLDGAERWLEVKTTRGNIRSSFFLTRTEHDVGLQHPEKWRLVRLFNFDKAPSLFRLRAPLTDRLNLQVDTWRASFG